MIESGAEVAGQFWSVLRRACNETIANPSPPQGGPANLAGKCTAVAGEFLDRGLGPVYMDHYKTGMKNNNPKLRPSVWAWHAYSDLGNVSPTQTATPNFARFRGFIGSSSSFKIWLTEQGSFVRKPDQTTQNEQEQDFQTNFLLDTFPRRDSRISRVYVYNWRGQPPTCSTPPVPPRTTCGQDSGLLPVTGNAPRPAYTTFLNTIR